MSTQGLTLYVGEGADPTAADALAAHLGVPVAQAGPDAKRDGLFLFMDSRGLALSNGAMEVRGDLQRMLPRVRNGVLQRELLVRAAKLKGAPAPLTAIDATAGLGEDALLLAAAGFHVCLYERNPIIAALLEDSLRRAATDPALAEYVARMRLCGEDSLSALETLGYRPDVIYLDPMFPEKRHQAASRKKLQLLQALETPCDDEQALFAAAQSTRPRKIVVKRPVKGPNLAGAKPSYSLAGKTVRYDCYV